MSKQIIRYSLWSIILFLTFIIFNAWENEKNLSEKLKIKDNDLKIKKIINEKIDENSTKEINISTNLIDGKINLSTGDITFLSLKNYSISSKDKKNVVIIDNKESNFSTINSNFLISEQKNTVKKQYSSNLINYFVNENELNLIINLEYKISEEILINKVYTFKPYAYDINVDFYVRNNEKESLNLYFYGILKQKKTNTKNSFLSPGLNISESGALYNNLKSYNKISLNESYLKNNSYFVNGGWIAFLKQYFIFSCIPDSNLSYKYTIKKEDENLYALQYITDKEINISPGECKCFESKLYIGPKIKNNLIKLHKGLDLTIDYGIFWPIASPIFILLNKINKYINNWGFSIILVTFLIKLLFFHLSSLSYESIGRMKKLQPRLNLLKERFKDDKKQFGQAVIDLYKKEKVNPLSGCFPILIQIPVFISLYYVLLESIELRQAPFIFWINDLSSKDEYYILPIIMCLTIFIQQKINPQIQDPLQAKIMMFMPFIFLIIFLQFPSGLVLYWIINNILSILQQIIITKNIKI